MLYNLVTLITVILFLFTYYTVFDNMTCGRGFLNMWSMISHILQESQSICELHGISFLDLLLVYEYYIYTACMYNICLPRECKVQTLAMGSTDSLFGLGLPEFIYFYIQMHTSTFQRVPSLNP